jgi:putative component of membrane protein insertase Oxa1/YidC/SpoIIIJ protein YidD
MANIAVGTIKLYRRYLSPLKGFRCAHNALHACGSCSGFLACGRFIGIACY